MKYGYCQCGCGVKTKINDYNCNRFKWVKGEPRKFIRGHHTRVKDVGVRFKKGNTPWNKEPVEKRFWDKVEKSDNCWEWKGYLNNDGYGKIKNNKKLISAHRFSYELHKGKIVKGLELDHLCRNRSCVNPEHLEAVTRQINVLRGNSPVSVNAKKTHCIRGHKFTPANIRPNKKGHRRCRKCRKIMKY